MALLSALVVALAASAADPGGDGLPDLVGDSVGPNVNFHVADVDGAGGQSERKLLRFDGWIHNAGSGRLTIRGEDLDPAGLHDRSMETIVQEGDAANGADLPLPGAATLKYEESDGHNHWHIGKAAEYTLLEGSTGDALAATAQKVGFCLIDSDPVAGGDWVYYDDECMQGDSTADAVKMALSGGWRDLYGYRVWLQWIDVSDVQPGDYRIRARMDPENWIREADETNNFDPDNDVDVRIPGRRAKASTTPVAWSGPTPVTLEAEDFSSTGAASYCITSVPAHGTLSRGVGSCSASPTVTYTPDDDARAAGSVSIGFTAEENGATFPESPAAAQATLQLPPPVVVTPAATAVEAEHQVSLSSSVPGVTWSVVSGGGTVAPATGATTTYTADEVAGPTVIRAAAGDGRVDEVTIDVLDHLAITPAAPEVEQGKTIALTSSVPNATWTIQSGGGSFPNATPATTKTLTAPALTEDGTVVVRATAPDGRTATKSVAVRKSIVVSPSPVSVQVGESIKIAANMAGVSWSKTEGGGSLGTPFVEGGVSKVVYTAPAAEGSAKVRATASAGRQAEATITITPTPPPVAVTPDEPAVMGGGEVDFSAGAIGDDQVTWSVSPAGSGSISAQGVYTAPDAAPSGLVTVTATAKNQPATRTDSVTFTVAPRPIVATGGTVEEGETLTLTSDPSGAEWEILENGGGSVAGDQYTAATSGPENVKVRASKDGYAAGDATIAVTARPLTITGGKPTLFPTQTMDLIATPSDDVSWMSTAGTFTTPGSFRAPGAPRDGVEIIAERHGRTDQEFVDVVAPPAIAISGAPADIVAGTSVPLTADRSPVTWTSDAGSISGAGVFTAPAEAGTTVTIRAYGEYTSTGSVQIRTVAPNPVLPIPAIPEAVTPALPPPSLGQQSTSKPKPKAKPKVLPSLGRLGARLSGNYVVASVTPGRAGKVRLSLVRGKKWLGKCDLVARKGQPVSCRFTVRGSRKRLRVVATLRSPRKKPYVKRFSVKKATHKHTTRRRSVPTLPSLPQPKR